MCEVCNDESGGKDVGVAAIPAMPMSVMWCNNCLRENAVPGFVMATWLFSSYEDHDEPVPDKPPPLNVFAPWILETKVWHEGRYKTFEEMLPIMWKIEKRRKRD